MLMQEKNNAEYSTYINAVKEALPAFCHPEYKIKPL